MIDNQPIFVKCWGGIFIEGDQGSISRCIEGSFEGENYGRNYRAEEGRGALHQDIFSRVFCNAFNAGQVTGSILKEIFYELIVVHGIVCLARLGTKTFSHI